MIADTDFVLGIYNKYDVHWKANAEGEHSLCFCDLFVLDRVHDKFARPTLKEYLRSSKKLVLPDQPYVVRRRSDPHGKHLECKFFVMNLTLDSHARKAMKVYSDLCLSEFPALHHDLVEMLRRNDYGQETS